MRMEADTMDNNFTVGKHPEAAKRSQLFKFAVFLNGQLFEGFVTRARAEAALVQVRREQAQFEAAGK